MAEENEMAYIETSAKQGKNVEDAFIKAIELISAKIEHGLIDTKNEVKIISHYLGKWSEERN